MDDKTPKTKELLASPMFYQPGLPLNIDTPSITFTDWLAGKFSALYQSVMRHCH